MTIRPWRDPDGWELLARRARSDATSDGISSLLVACEVLVGGATYEYVQHWLNGQLATWEARGSCAVDLVIRRDVASEDQLWSAPYPALALASDRFRTPACPVWSSYPPTPHGFTSVDEAVEAEYTVRVRLRLSDEVTSEIILSRLENGDWTEWRGSPGHALPLCSEQLVLELDDSVWTRLALGRCSFAAVLDRVNMSGDALMIGALQSGLATMSNLSASTVVWPAILLYEEYVRTMRMLDTAELRLKV